MLNSMRLILGYTAVAAVLVFVGIFLHRSVVNYCMPDTHAFLTIGDSNVVSRGYILVAPYFADSFYEHPGEVYLIDSLGHIAHTWHTQYQVLYAILQANGHLFVSMTPPINQAVYPSGGTTGLIQELDWSGKVLWEYSDDQMTHDFEVLPDGSVAYTRWESTPKSFAMNVQGGMKVSTSTVWANGIVVVNREKQILWKWDVAAYLDPRNYVLSPLMPRSDWAHLNSLRYTADNPITHTPAFLISVRDISTVFFIDAHTGMIIWQSPKGMLSLQHDATLLQNGDVMVFDNGLFREQPRAYLASRVIEIDPHTNKIVWQYDGGGTGTEDAQFASSIMGGAQRLSNGNTLITVSTQGRMLEVTPDKIIVWDYTSRYLNNEGKSRIIYKARKYSADGTTWGASIGWGQSMRDILCKI
jgi:hypothetical protein